MDTIIISDLEVYYCVGVSEAERARPQRLLVSVAMERDLSAAAHADDLAESIDYFAVAGEIIRFGSDCQWQLIETVAEEIAAMILGEFKPSCVTVEIKKFVLPQARHVSVRLTRPVARGGKEGG